MHEQPRPQNGQRHPPLNDPSRVVFHTSNKNKLDNPSRQGYILTCKPTLDGGVQLKIAFDKREVNDQPFFAYVKEDVLHLPQVFKPLCETQGLDDAEAFLAFFDRDPVTVSILLRSLTVEALQDTKDQLLRMVMHAKIGDSLHSLRSMISERPGKSEDLTPTVPAVDTTADTPPMPEVAHNETAAAE